MKYTGLYAPTRRHSFLLAVISLLYITPAIYAMNDGQYRQKYPMEQEEKEDGTQAPVSPRISLPTFSRWATITGIYSLNAPEEFPDPELADIEYTSHLLKRAQTTYPEYYFESFDQYVRERQGDGDAINLEQWTGSTTTELYKEYLETSMGLAQKLREKAARKHARQVRATIALKIIPGHETFELKLCNGDTWDSFQEKIAQQTQIPAEFQKILIGGEKYPNSLENLIAWVDSARCILVKDSRRDLI